MTSCRLLATAAFLDQPTLLFIQAAHTTLHVADVNAIATQSKTHLQAKSGYVMRNRVEKTRKTPKTNFQGDKSR